MRKIVVVSIIVIAGIALLYITDLLSFQRLCGFRPGPLSEPGKEWKCTCVGKVDEVVNGYTLEQYCTGLNLSYNRTTNIVGGIDTQKLIYQPISLERPIKGMCGNTEICKEGKECVGYYDYSGVYREGCYYRCPNGDTDCPEGNKCVEISDGPKDICL